MALGISYENARPLITDLDIVGFSRKNFISNGIRVVTRSIYSHVGTTIILRGRVCLIEAVGSGVRFIPLSKLGEFHWIPTEVKISEETLDFMFNCIGDGYSISDCLLAVFGGANRTNGKWQCSEIVNQIFSTQGVILADSDTPADVMEHGSEIWRLPILVKP